MPRAVFSEATHKYAIDVFLWSSFWIVSGVWGFIGWTYALIFVFQTLVAPGPERLPVMLAYLTGLAIFGTTYVCTYRRWSAERAETIKAAKSDAEAQARAAENAAYLDRQRYRG